MKYLSLLIFSLIIITSCSKSESEDSICTNELSCIDEFCLFTINSEQGTTTFLNCYQAWSIFAAEDGEAGSWYIVDEWDDSYKVEGKKVTFCGYVRENTLPLILPDPMPGNFYQISLEGIEEVEE